MEYIEIIETTPYWTKCIFVLLIVWEVIWKLIAMWRAARNNQAAWYIFLVIFNTVGILAIIYLLTHKKKSISQ